MYSCAANVTMAKLVIYISAFAEAINGERIVTFKYGASSLATTMDIPPNHSYVSCWHYVRLQGDYHRLG